MADFTNIKSTINAQVKQNGTGAITGSVLNGVLNGIVDAVNDKKSDPVTISQNTETGKTSIQVGGGTAVDAANGSIADVLLSIIDKNVSNNKCNPDDVLYDKGIDASGNVVDSAGKCVTGIIEVSGDYIFFAKDGVNANASRVAVYDADKNFITRLSTTGSGTLLDSQYKYVRVQLIASAPALWFVGFADSASAPDYDEYSISTKVKKSAIPDSVADDEDIDSVKSYSDGKLDAFENSIITTQVSNNKLDPADILYNTGIDSAGNIVASPGTCISGLIEITDDYIFFGINGSSANAHRLATYDANGDFIERKSAVASGTFIDRDICKYIRVQFNQSDEGTIYYTSFYPAATTTPIYDEYGDKRFIKPALVPFNVNPYDGLDAVAFGTSLTERADRDSELGITTTFGYLTELRSLSGMTIDNQAQGGATILSDVSTKSIYSQIMNYGNYGSKRVCIIEGFVNDWYKNGENTLGQYTDADSTSVCGRLRLAITHILTENPNITIFVILDHYGRNSGGLDFSSPTILNGKTQYQYYEELAKVCESMGIICIKEYATSGISELTPQYLVDYIHCNELGAKQSGNIIWDWMKRFSPNKRS